MALAFPDISPDIFTLPEAHVGGLTLGPFPLRWYAMAYIAGILLGWRYAVGLVSNARLWKGRPPPATPLQIDDLILWITLGVILGGRLGYVLFYMVPLPDARAELFSDPLVILRVWQGGMSFHGGAIGVSLAIVGYALAKRLPLLGLADVVAACAPIGLFFGRIANFINGELWGRPTDLPWGMIFCARSIPTAPDGSCIAGHIARHPSQLYEAALEGLVLFAILRIATHGRGWLVRRGAVTGLFLAFYGLFRFSLEHVRMPDPGLRHLPYGVTVGELLSAPMMLIGIWMIWRAWRAPLPAAVDDDPEPAPQG